MANQVNFSQVNFSDAQLVLLSAALEQLEGIDDSTFGKYKPAYDLVNPWVQSSNADSQTKLFFRLAVEVNSNADTAANCYIRAVTKGGLRLPPPPVRNGNDSDESIQRTSSVIARAIFNQISTDHGVRSLGKIIQLDVTGAIDQGGQSWGGWGGSLFFLAERSGPQGQSIAQMIFSEENDTTKFKTVTVDAAKQTIDRFRVAGDFHDALVQAAKSDFIAVVSLATIDLSLLQAIKAARTLIDIVTQIDAYAYRADPDGYRQEMHRLLPLDDLPQPLPITAGVDRDLRITVTDSTSVQTIIADSDDMEKLAAWLGQPIVVSASDQLTVAMFGTNETNRLAGTQSIDTIFGGDGADLLSGGAGNDTLEGGEGIDRYSFKSGDGDDHIVDNDGLGDLFRNNRKIAFGVKTSTDAWSLTGSDGVAITYTQNNTDLEITFSDNPADKITIKDFDFANAAHDYLGIRLIDAPSMLQNPVRTFYGDKQDWDSDPGQTGIQTQDDGFDNSVRADGQDSRPDVAQAGRADLFYGSSADQVELFQTGAGDDVVYADGASSVVSAQGGTDLIYAGAGRDIVAAGANNDWIEGGPGADILGGNAGNDVIYADSSNGGTLTLDQAIAAGESGAALPGPGELMSADAGDDVILGGASADAILGGDGEDVIVGGAGDDTIYGDGLITTAALDWTLARTITNDGGVQTFHTDFVNVTILTDDALGGLDVIYGGAGDDWIMAGAGADSVDGGADDDVLFGEAGNDFLSGGAGNDRLFGDSASVDTAGLSGDDYLDGGIGNDTIYGGKGNDTIRGRAGACKRPHRRQSGGHSLRHPYLSVERPAARCCFAMTNEILTLSHTLLELTAEAMTGKHDAGLDRGTEARGGNTLRDLLRDASGSSGGGPVATCATDHSGGPIKGNVPFDSTQ